MPSVVAATELCKNQFDSDWKLGKEELLEVISTRDGGRVGSGRRSIRAMDKTPHTLCKARIDGWLRSSSRPPWSQLFQRSVEKCSGKSNERTLPVFIFGAFDFMSAR